MTHQPIATGTHRVKAEILDWLMEHKRDQIDIVLYEMWCTGGELQEMAILIETMYSRSDQMKHWFEQND